MERRGGKRVLERQPVQASIEVITGSMLSGKSDELIRIIRRLPHAKYSVMVFKPDTDFRRGTETINSASGAEHKAYSVKRAVNILEVLNDVNPNVDVVAIDEAQFFDMNLVEVCQILAASGKRVIVAGLDLDFRGEPFGPMGKLKQIATHTQTEHAQCSVCGREASRTQRIFIDKDGKIRPAHYDEPQVVVGAEELYQARCLDHHEVPGRPETGVLNGKEKDSGLNILISGSNREIGEMVVKVLEKAKLKYYRSPVKSDDVKHQTDEEKLKRNNCDLAIFVSGRGDGVQELKEWKETGKPGLFLVRGPLDVANWHSSVKALVDDRIGVFTNAKELKQIVMSYVREIRLQVKR